MRLRPVLQIPASSSRVLAGCKIKALRAKTNTYIKTPVRGEPPIFSISGRPDHVNSAKYEIIAAAEHFSQIRAARPTPNVGPGTDKVTIYVKVPYRVVGLVVGPRGSTVKRIQLMTRTFIVTPSRDKEPYFEVKGTPENVERARKEIESYIQMRTGSKCDDDDSDSVSGISSPDSLVEQMQQKCKIADTTATGAQYPLGAGTSSYLGLPPDCSQWSPPVSNMSFSGMQFTPPDNSYQPMSAPLLTADKASFDFGGGNVGKPQPLSPTGSYESTSSDGLGANSPKQQSPLVVKKTVSSCWNCRASDEMAALIPCGHNMFCQTCAHYITCSSGCCPICGAQVTNVMYI